MEQTVELELAELLEKLTKVERDSIISRAAHDIMLRQGVDATDKAIVLKALKHTDSITTDRRSQVIHIAVVSSFCTVVCIVAFLVFSAHQMHSLLYIVAGLNVFAIAALILRGGETLDDTQTRHAEWLLEHMRPEERQEAIEVIIKMANDSPDGETRGKIAELKKMVDVARHYWACLPEEQKPAMKAIIDELTLNIAEEQKRMQKHSV